MDKKLEKGLTHSLNTNGYSFQYAVLEKAKSCFEVKESPWVFEVSEFPVSINGLNTHIDFVLSNKNEPFYLIAECKRANPSISNWCFVKAPYVSRNITSGERIVREVVRINKQHSPPRIDTCLDWIDRSKEIYRLAFEIKSGQKGDAAHGRGQVNEATTQVLKGVNGLVSFFVNYYKEKQKFPLGSYVRNEHRAAFMPVIFTTANLWVSDVDLSAADIENGNIDIEYVQMQPKEWLFFQCPQSNSIKHDFGNIGKSDELSELLYHEYTRTIPIVNSQHIESFFKQYFWNSPEDWRSDS